MQLRSLSPAQGAFADNLLLEEAQKVDRLERLSTEISLPIYESSRFVLHSEFDAYQKRCLKITNDSAWQLAIRINRAGSGEVLFRAVGISAEEAIAAVKELPVGDTCVATVTPYKLPARSGTLLRVNGQLIMELVFGPHMMISKGIADAGDLFHCSYGPFTHSVKYSTTDENTRVILFAMFQKATKSIFGSNLRDAADWNESVYAEFHWHKNIGFRFIECTFSPAWGAKMKEAFVSQG
jgi:hypothetical protein